MILSSSRFVTRAAAGLGCLLAAALDVTALQVEMEVTPRVLRLGESATCRIILRDAQGAPPPSLPPLSGFEVVPAGTEQRFEIVNGRQSSYSAHLFRLTPHAAGEFQLGPFRYEAGSETATIAPITIQVLPQTGPSGEPRARSLDELIFASLTATRTNVYANEVFDLLLQLYTQPGINLDRNVSLLDFDTSGLALSGFEELSSTREVISGQVYDVRRFRARTTALTSGRFVLEPRLRVNVIVPRERERVRDPFFGDGIFDNFFNRVETRPHTIISRPLSLTVMDIPTAGRPADYSGAVGRYSFEVQAAPLQMRVGEPITIRYRVQGRGNIDTVSPPPVNWPEGFRAFDTKLVDQNSRDGVKIFEQVVIPRALTATNLPAIRFTYFDSESGQFETIERGPFALELKPGEQMAHVADTSTRASGTQSSPLGADLVYLKPAPVRWDHRADTPATKPLIHTLPALALIAAWLYGRRRDHLVRNPEEARRAQAPRRARAGIKRAQDHLDKGELDEAVRALSETLSDYFGRLMALPPGRISADEICGRLHTRGLSHDRLETLRAIFRTCEQVQFAGRGVLQPDSLRQDLKQQLDRVGPLLQAIRRLPR